MSVLRGPYTVGKGLRNVGLASILVGCTALAARLSLGGLLLSMVGFVLEITMFLLAQMFGDDWWLE